MQAGAGHGTGFLIDSLGGVIVTNEHVVSNSDPTEISVFLDASTRVPTQVLARDRDADLALLRVHPSLITLAPRLRIAAVDSTGAIAVAGERVLAVGYPLSQQITVTSGIVSGVRQGAIISDVNINQGNSGGPMLNMAGDVIAINTFGESPERGPGLSGAVSALRIRPLLEQARRQADRLPLPGARRLPIVPPVTYSVSSLRAIADTASDRTYDQLAESRQGDFVVSLSTPVSALVAFKGFDDALSRNRRNREARAGIPVEQRYSVFAPLHDWFEFVGDQTHPVVTVDISPRTGETAGSSWGRALSAALAGVQQRARMEFKGDVQSVRFYSNGRLVEPVIGGRLAQRAYVDNAWITMSDVAYRGYYVLRPEVFAPDSTGVPPSIIMVIRDLKHLDRENVVELDAAIVARIWGDFLPYQELLGMPRQPRADPRRFRTMWPDFCRTRNCWHGAADNALLASLLVTPVEGLTGVLVQRVDRGSPLGRAGLRSGWTIITVDGDTTRSWAEFQSRVSSSPVDSLRLGIIGGLWGGPRRDTTVVVRASSSP